VDFPSVSAGATADGQERHPEVWAAGHAAEYDQGRGRPGLAPQGVRGYGPHGTTARTDRAWYLRDPNCEPQQQRWHARSRAGCGLAATYAKAADSKFRACTCSAAVETLQHVYLVCPHYTAARAVLKAAVDDWCAAMQSRDELDGVCSARRCAEMDTL
jgi:hypothetical protein